MRVISGKARHIALQTVGGNGTRPTTDRIKETLFNMLTPYIPGCRFLDLFAGSGAIGIEALSRGAAWCDFVEKNPQAVSCIKNNLQKTKLVDACVYTRDVFGFLAQKTDDGKCEPYDIVFLDPPYRHMLEERVLEQLKISGAAGNDTLVIIEAAIETEFLTFVERAGFEVLKVKTYKTNQHIFVQKVKVG